MNKVAPLCVTCVVILLAAGLVQAAKVVEVDLNARFLKATLPFDVPFYIKGKVGENVYEVRAHYWQVPDSLRKKKPSEIEEVFEKAKKAGVTTVVFDRGWYKFHGRVKALADAARKEGLEF